MSYPSLDQLMGDFMKTEVSIDVDIHGSDSSSDDTAEAVESNDTPDEQEMKEEAENAQEAVETSDAEDTQQEAETDAQDAEMIFKMFDHLNQAQNHISSNGVSREWLQFITSNPKWKNILGVESIDQYPVVGQPNTHHSDELQKKIWTHLDQESEFLHQVAQNNLSYLEKIIDQTLNRVGLIDQKWDHLSNQLIDKTTNHPVKAAGYNIYELNNGYRSSLNAHHNLHQTLGISNIVPGQEGFAQKIASMVLKPGLWFQKKILNMRFRMNGKKPYLVSLTYFAQPTSKPNAFKQDSWKLEAVVITYMVDFDKFEIAKLEKGVKGVEGTRNHGNFDENFISKVVAAIGCSKFTAKAAMIKSMKESNAQKKLDKYKEATPQLIGYFKGQSSFPDDLAREVKQGKAGKEEFVISTDIPTERLVAGLCSFNIQQVTSSYQHGDSKKFVEDAFLTWCGRPLNIRNEALSYAELAVKLQEYTEAEPSSLLRHREELRKINQCIPQIAETFLSQFSFLNKTYHTLNNIIKG